MVEVSFKETFKSLTAVLEAAAKAGLTYSSHDLPDIVIEYTMPSLDNVVSKIQRRLKRNKIKDTPLVAPKPRVALIEKGITRYNAPVESYFSPGSPRVNNWAYIFFEKDKILARWRCNKPYRGVDEGEPSELSARQLLKLWWDAPRNFSAATGDGGFITQEARLHYNPKSLLLVLEAMRTADIKNSEICPYDSYRKFVALTKKFDPKLANDTVREQAWFEDSLAKYGPIGEVDLVVEFEDNHGRTKSISLKGL
jgi:hypothetical protein